MNMDRFISRFEVPKAAISVIEKFIYPEEILLIEALSSESFTNNDAKECLEVSTGVKWPDIKLELFLQNAYKRGIILLEDENYKNFRIGNFYGRLDIFAVTETDKYNNLPREVQIALDDWYFNAYLSRLGDNLRPSEDKVVTLQQALNYIDTIDLPIWLNHCDCRILAGYCNKPTDTCISFRNGINTMSHRGWSKSITKDEAKEVVRRADKSGLMHTINPNGMCNCCGDCCYLFRAQKARNSVKAWPFAENIAVFYADKCIACGLCTKRCHFNAFSIKEGEISYNPEHCRGCGICTESCPSSAIIMKGRL